MTTQTLTVVRGILTSLPTDSRGGVWEPYQEGIKCWAATLMRAQDSKAGPERMWWTRPRPAGRGAYVVPTHIAPGMAVEFGVSYPPKEPNVEETTWVPKSDSHTSLVVRAVDDRRRRWYGVVTDVNLDDNRTGEITIMEVDGDAKACLRQARASGMAPLTEQETQLLRDAGKVGDCSALGILADLLTDRNDPRGEELRRGVRELVKELFPEDKTTEQSKPEDPTRSNVPF